MSTFSIEETLSTEENWFIHVDKHNYILLRFELFDIGCQLGSILEIKYSTQDKRRLCNLNRAVFGLKSTDNHLEIKWYLVKKAGDLMNGFTGNYITQSKQNITAGLLTKQETGISAYIYPETFIIIYRSHSMVIRWYSKVRQRDRNSFGVY